MNADDDGDARCSDAQGKATKINCARQAEKFWHSAFGPDVRRVAFTLPENVSILFRFLCYLIANNPVIQFQVTFIACFLSL